MRTALYEVIEQKEVLYECMAGFLADVRHLMVKQNVPVSDIENPLAVLYRKSSVISP